MPSEIMDRRFFSEEPRFPSEKEVGCWKSEFLPCRQGTEGMPLISGSSKSVSASPMDNIWQVGPSYVEEPELSQHSLHKCQMTKFGLEHHLFATGNDTGPSFNVHIANVKECEYNTQTNLNIQHAPPFQGGKRVDMNGFHHDNGHFSSSFSELLDRRLKLSSNLVSMGKSLGAVNSNYDEEPLESLEEIEAQTIGNLLPDDDDDLLSGIIDGVGSITRPNSGDDIDDIFCTAGGMELDGDDSHINASNLTNGIGSKCRRNGSTNGFAREHPYGEHPSRTLFVRNISSSVDDSEWKILFERYGEIQSLYTGCKHRGFVMISYYDLRAAQNAVKSLQNEPLGRWKLDIHFSIPKDNPSDKDRNQGILVASNLDPSVSNDDISQIFGIYGEIKEIREAPNKHHCKFIEFYDIRAADAALHALKGRNVTGQKIKLQPWHPACERPCSLTQQFEEFRNCRHDNNSHSSSLPGQSGCIPLGSIISDSAVRAPVSPLFDSVLNGISSSHNLSSAVRVPSIGNHSNPSGLCENNYYSGQMKFELQGMPVIHNSLPEYHHGVTNGVMALNINSRPAGGFDHGYIQKVGSGSLSNHSLEAAFAAGSGNGSGSLALHGNQYVWHNANAYPQHSASSLIWGNSPSFTSNFLSHRPPPVNGTPRVPSHMLNNVIQLHTHHVGSAPSVNPTIWERRAFHPVSLDSMDLLENSPRHPLELAPGKVLSHSAGNCVDHVGISSHQQRGHMYQGRNHINPMSPSLDAPTDRVRSRRGEINTSQTDSKKQYELDIQRIMRCEDSRTTLMIKNIPNKYTSKMLLATIDEQHKGTYDFIYLPIDFKNKCNVGYAFINMIDPQHIIPFYQAFNGRKWEKFNSEKVASIAYARIQGKSALIGHFQNSSLMNEDKRCRPILFISDGPNAGDQEPFPMGTNIRSRLGRPRCYGNADNNQISPATSPNGAGLSNATYAGTSANDS